MNGSSTLEQKRRTLQLVGARFVPDAAKKFDDPL